MMWANLLLSVLLAVLCLKVNAYLSYQKKIPNGDMVPNPCNLSTIWTGVGHENSQGAGPRNPFGLDFAANNHVWDRTLCQKDSDGDGRTNGQELGDPNCTWAEGSTPALRTNLSHPGVCEPLDSHMCTGKNSWLMGCMPKKLNCPAINEPGVRNYTLRFPVTPVPTQETTYICHQFVLPNDTVSDIIAIEPVIGNPNVLHHMLLYACTEQQKDNPTDRPYECGMFGGAACQSLLGVWGVGMAGQCLNSELGFRCGPGGFQYVVLQLHWNNMGNKANLMDSSGMRIYHTTQLRPNRGQVAVVGQSKFEIPPGQPKVTITGNCSSICTKHLPRSIFITSSFLHMHSLGKSGDIRLSRNGELVRVLDNVTNYDYNSPTLAEFATPIEIKPGDEIQMKCVYNSTQKNSTTYFGEATSDEMCYGFFAYYPLLQGLGYCGQWKSVSICNTKFDTEFGSCDFNTLKTLVGLLPNVCAENCTSKPCALIIDGILATGCQNYPDVMAFIKAFMFNNHIIFERCVMGMPPKPKPTAQGPQCTQQDAGSNSAGQGDHLYFGFILTLVTYAMQQ